MIVISSSTWASTEDLRRRVPDKKLSRRMAIGVWFNAPAQLNSIRIEVGRIDSKGSLRHALRYYRQRVSTLMKKENMAQPFNWEYRHRGKRKV